MTEDDYKAEIARLTKERDELLDTNGELANTVCADALRLRAVLANVKVFDTGHHVFIGVVVKDGCASAEVSAEDRGMFLEWKQHRDAAMATPTTPTPGSQG